MWVIINNDGGITMENEKKKGLTPWQKERFKQKKRKQWFILLLLFHFLHKKAHKEHCVPDWKKKMQEKNIHVQLINKSEKHISSKKY